MDKEDIGEAVFIGPSRMGIMHRESSNSGDDIETSIW